MRKYCYFSSTIVTSIPLHYRYCRQSHVNRNAVVEVHGGMMCVHDLLRMSPGWVLGQGLADPKKYGQNDSIDNSQLVEVRGLYPPTKHTERYDPSSGRLKMFKKTLKRSHSREAETS